MYVARHQPSGDEITILDPRWKAQLGYLKNQDKLDALVCPGCLQPVRVRAGQFKRWHFAHKHLQNCPFERESPRLLQTRAVLYDWLIAKFGAEAVRIEKRVEASELPRYFDAWVEFGEQPFAYWIFDRRMPPDERQHLKSACKKIGVDVHWVFVVELLHMDDLNPASRLHLTTTERAFMQPSELDKAWQTHFDQLGSSLHYLDPDLGNLTTYRNLSVVHPPQLYAGKRLQTPLAELGVSRHNGEFIHPGEPQQLEQRQKTLDTQQRQAEERLRRAQRFFKGAALDSWAATQKQEVAAPIPNLFERSATCKICGKVTSDWVTYFGQTKECICRECSAIANKGA